MPAGHAPSQIAKGAQYVLPLLHAEHRTSPMHGRAWTMLLLSTLCRASVCATPSARAQDLLAHTPAEHCRVHHIKHILGHPPYCRSRQHRVADAGHGLLGVLIAGGGWRGRNQGVELR